MKIALKKLEVKGFVSPSFVDWSGRISSVLFLPRCNLRCPFCFNATLVLRPEELPTIPIEEVERLLKKDKGWVDGVVITGGEPTVHEELPDLCRRIKLLGFDVKVDTNGANPNLIEALIEEGLVDYVAMDVKAPLDVGRYSVAAGVDVSELLPKVERTIDLLLNGKIPYEFRTTLVPTIHEERDVGEICKRIRGCRRYVLQNFKVSEGLIDKRLKGVRPFSRAELEAFKRVAERIIPNVVIGSY